MKAAVVFDLAEGPVWADFIDPQPAPGQTLIDVRAAAISHVVKARASGRHYSFDGNLPFVPGIDGVGTTCLLYTSDAADDQLCVDLGGRRILKKKKKRKKRLQYHLL